MSDTCTDPLGHRLNIAGYCVRCGSFVPLTATLRQHAADLAKSLELTLDILDRVRRGESFTIEASIGNSQTTETARERLSAWREGPGARSKGQGEG